MWMSKEMPTAEEKLLPRTRFWAGDSLISFLLVTIIAAIALTTWNVDAKTPDADAEPRPQLIFVKPKGYEPKPVTKESAEGESRFLSLNCVACHSIHGIGGRLGPILDGIGQQRSAEYLTARLASSDAQRSRFVELTGKRSPLSDVHIRLAEDTTKKIVAFLLTLPEPPGGFVIAPHVVRLPAENHPPNPNFRPAKTSESSQEGKMLFEKFGCQACHSVANIGGWFGPRLDGVGGLYSRSYIVDHITDAQVHAAKNELTMDEKITGMQKLDATAEEIRKIADYLETLPSGNLPPHRPVERSHH